MSASAVAPFIVLEGPEGAGKTTQLGMLADRLRARGRPFIGVREPGGTPLGDSIRAILLDPTTEIEPRAEALLFMASRAQLVQRTVRPALEQGMTVLADRFFLSTYAYQGAGRGLDLAELAKANAAAVGDLKPGLTILLRLPVDVGLARAAARGVRDRMESVERGFHQRVARAFEEYCDAEWQSAHPECGPVVAVDATGEPAAVFARVLQQLVARWPDVFGEK